MASIKLDPLPGTAYIDRERSTDKQAIQKIFGRIQKGHEDALRLPGARPDDTEWLKAHFLLLIAMVYTIFAYHVMPHVLQ